MLAAAAAVVATSAWTKEWLIEQYALEPDRIHVVEPGVDAAELAPGTPGGGELLCVAAVTPAKGHDVLVTALAEVKDLPGAAFAPAPPTSIRVSSTGSARSCPGWESPSRMRFVGTRVGAELEAALRRRRRRGAVFPCRNVCDGRHGGAGAGNPGDRHRGRRGAGGARIRRRLDSSRHPGATRRPARARRGPTQLARRCGSPTAVAPGSTRAPCGPAGWATTAVVSVMCSLGRQRDMPINRTVWRWVSVLGGAAVLAALVWRLGVGPFVDGITMVDGHALISGCRHHAVHHGVQCLAVATGGAWTRSRHSAACCDRRVLSVAVSELGAARRRAG